MDDENPTDEPKRPRPATTPSGGSGSGIGGRPTRVGSGAGDDDDDYKRKGILSPEQWQQVQVEREKSGDSISVILYRLGFADENQIKNALELQFGVSYFPLSRIETPVPDCMQLLPPALMQQHQLVPVLKNGNRVTIAMVNPNNLVALEDIKVRLKGMQVKLAVCTEIDFQLFMEKVYPGT